MEMKKCEDCLAHYSKGYPHICPPWLKAIVKAKKEKDKEKSNENEV